MNEEKIVIQDFMHYCVKRDEKLPDKYVQVSALSKDTVSHPQECDSNYPLDILVLCIVIIYLP